ncbi:right-handed parallel beta-helix repeat-containing protein, partial [bacterium]|nr:right-handed parallel beta-helix repeat-containing protein [bacterium]
GSPCIDGADDALAPATDADGNPRRDDPGIPNLGVGPPWADMGAYEFQGDSPAMRALVVESTHATAVPITGDTPGATPYHRICADGASVTLTAPAQADGLQFVRWEDGGGTLLTRRLALSLVIGADTTVVAVYEAVTDFYVNDETAEDGIAPGDEGNAGTSPESPMRHIQVLLDRYPTIGTGCTVHVSAGTYVENIVIDADHSGLTLQGAGADRCTIDGGATDTCIHLILFDQGSIAGFTICNGAASYGGGVRFNSAAGPTLRDCVVRDNVSSTWGGGIYAFNCTPTLRDCTVQDNTSQYGGGLFLYMASATAERLTVTGNTASLEGGGIRAYDSSPTLRECTVKGNTAVYGAGFYFHTASPTLDDVAVVGNTASGQGGGLFLHTSSASISHTVIAGNAATNHGVGIFTYNESPTVSHVTIHGNRAQVGGGIYAYAPPPLPWSPTPSSGTTATTCSNAAPRGRASKTATRAPATPRRTRSSPPQAIGTTQARQETPATIPG